MTRGFQTVRTLCFLGCALAWLAGPGTLRAHDVKEMTINARVHADRIELIIVASNHMAAAILAGPGGEAPALNARTFDALRSELEQCGKTLCTLASVPPPSPAEEEKNSVALAPASIDVRLAREDEVMFFLTYPPAKHETLRLVADVLDRVEPGHVVNLKVLDTRRKSIAEKALTRGDKSVTIALAVAAREQEPATK